MAHINIPPQICEDPHPFKSLLKLTAIVVVAYFLSAFITFLLMLQQGINYNDISSLSEPSADLRSFLLIAQTVTSIIIFIIAPIVYIYKFENKNIQSLSVPEHLTLIAIMLTLLIVIISFLPNASLINWNKNLILPEFMASWAKEKEDLAERVTNIFLDFKSPIDFLITFFIVGIIAPIGEELLFRGLLQNKLRTLTANAHIAIWITAILFSAIHAQFYGFFPRMFLGVLFGYLYYWSGNIIIPMFAHFVNNGFQVIALYLYKLKVHNIDIDDTPDISWTLTVSGLIVTAGLLFSFWKYYFGKRLLQ